jgi:hypothetical protein
MTLLEQPVQLECLGIRELLTMRVKPVPPSPKDLAHWRALSDQATPGPWQWAEEKWNTRLKQNDRSRYVYCLQGPPYDGSLGERWVGEFDYYRIMTLRWAQVKGDTLLGGSPTQENREFIAAARTALPRLLDYVASLEAENARLKEQSNDG